MKKVMIWDVPIRVFHWAFALCSVGALSIALFVDDDSALFPVHMLLGITACFLLLVRLVLAIVGSKPNRFSAMFFSPLETLRYVGGVFVGRAPRYFVHNPGTTVATLGMFLVVPLLFLTGLEVWGDAEDVHEILAYALLALVGMHLVGLAIHTLRYRENISLSMITGTKESPPEHGLRSAHPLWGAVCLLLVVLWISALFTNYRAATRTVTLPMLRISIPLGDQGHDDHRKESRRSSKDHD